MASKNQYVPGVCNIGPAEIASRRKTGWFGLVLTILLGAVFFSFKLPIILFIILGFTSFLAAVGFIQAGLHFCAGFGMTGLFNFSENLSQTETADQADWRAADRRKAILIFVASIVIGVIVVIATSLIRNFI